MMRLIDADALKEAVNTKKVVGRFNTIQLIDNAPTVEYTFEEAFQKTVCEQRSYCPQRPHGKWKETGYKTGALGITYQQTQCSNCGWEYALPMWWNFCPNCGAEMRKEAEDE